MTSLPESIVRHVPYLRRYARALTATQELGDYYVRLCLQAIAADPGRLEEDQPIRRQLYKQFQDTIVNVVNGPPYDRRHASGEGPPSLESLVCCLPTVERQVLLLAMVEKFAQEDVAVIMGLPPVAIAELLARARRDLLEQCATTVLVIEDEPVIAFDIAGILIEMGHRVVGTAATRADAVDKARKVMPGLLLADIRLDDGSSGVQAVNEIMALSEVPVVFVTAFPERLLTGQRREPIYLVTKPFEPEVLKVTVAQALFGNEQSSPVGLTA